MLVSLRKFSGTSLTTRREPWREAAAVCLTAPKWEEGAEAFPSVRVDPAAAPPVRETPSRVCLRDTTCRSFLRFVCFFFSHLLHKSLGNPPLRWTALRGSPRPERGGGGGREGGRAFLGLPAGLWPKRESQLRECGPSRIPSTAGQSPAAQPVLTSRTGPSQRGSRSPAWLPPAPSGPPSGSLAKRAATASRTRGGVSRLPQEAGIWLVGSRAAARTPFADWWDQSGARSQVDALAAGRPEERRLSPERGASLAGQRPVCPRECRRGGGCWFTAAEAAFVVRRRTEWKCRRGREVNVGAREAVGQRAHGRVEPVTWGEIWTAAQSGMQIGCEVETAHSASACRGLASVFWIHGGAAKLERFAFCLYSLSVIQCSYIPGCDMQLPCEISLHKSDGHWRAEVQMPNSCGIVGAFTVINCTKSSALFSLQLSFGWGSGILGVCSLCLWHSLNWMYIWF